MRHFLLFVFLILTVTLSAQDLNWTKHLSSEGRDYPIMGGADSEGNIYSIGFYRDADLELDNGAILPNRGGMDSYIVKYSSTGNQLWSISLTGEGLFDRVQDMHVDDEDNLYVLSTIEGEFIIGDQKTILPPAENSIDFVLMKFDSDGILLFSEAFGGTGHDIAYGMTVYDDEILLSGFTRDKFIAGGETYTSSGLADMLIVSTDLEGSVNWVQLYGAAESQDRLYSVARLSNNNIVACGYSEGGFTFGETSIPQPALSFNGFIGLLDPTGTPIRAKTIESTTGSSQFSDLEVIDDKVYTISNLSDSSILNGKYYGQADYNTFIISQLSAELDYNWIQDLAGNSEDSYIYSFSIAEYEGNVWLAGYYFGEIEIDGQSYNTTQENGLYWGVNEDGIRHNITEIKTDSSFTSSHMFFGENTLTIAGTIQGTTQIDGRTLETKGQDIILLNYSSDFITALSSPEQESHATILPNPADQYLEIIDPDNDFDSYYIVNTLGQMTASGVIKNYINLHALSPGTYSIVLYNTDYKTTKKFVKL